MKTQDAIKHFGSQRAVARALRIKQPSVCRWKEYPPAIRQLQLAALSGGHLQPEPGCLESLIGLVQQTEAA
ncbi:Cro/CI family transcriptional regulator [Hydrogenophaga sp.]|uniref:Cro/CI family transcriptional regulator n=1 Tax=Hydrogenophaga sp. TaxID=1904254 RepID=UPI00351D5E6E